MDEPPEPRDTAIHFLVSLEQANVIFLNLCELHCQESNEDNTLKVCIARNPSLYYNSIYQVSRSVEMMDAPLSRLDVPVF